MRSGLFSPEVLFRRVSAPRAPAPSFNEVRAIQPGSTGEALGHAAVDLGASMRSGLFSPEVHAPPRHGQRAEPASMRSGLFSPEVQDREWRLEVDPHALQ